MRPMKLAGSQLMFGEGCLEYIKNLTYKRVIIVTGGSSMEKSGILAQVADYFESAGATVAYFSGVEADPSFATVYAGSNVMKEFQPDLIVGLGGGSVMDAAKTMWVYYEQPNLHTIEDLLTASPFPILRKRAHFCGIPSTAGTASEVSRSVVISDDNGIKHGIGNMEMMPDIAICDPLITLSMPKHLTAETGMDAMTHALEAYVSNRANYVSDILAKQAILDIFSYLPIAYEEPNNIVAREMMLNASMVAGLAFTNVSLGIVHSMAHALGSYFHIAHGLANAILNPFVINYNLSVPYAREKYQSLERAMGVENFVAEVRRLNRKIGIPNSLSQIIPDAEMFKGKLEELIMNALSDGCTKTNPLIPSFEEMKNLFIRAYEGEREL